MGQYVNLIFSLFRMNLRDRYLGSFIGGVWAIITPLFLLSVFTFVFGFVFKARLPGAETTLGYAIWLICGYGPWLAINEGLISSTNSVVSGSALVKNLPLKGEALPVAGALMGIVPLAVSLVFLVLLMWFDGAGLGWHILLLIPMMAVQFVFIAGLGLILASLNVFVRDIAQIVPTLLLVTMFLTPIFYSIQMFPTQLQWVTAFNPFFVIVDSYRTILLDAHLPRPGSLVYLGLLSLFTFWVGWIVFGRLKPYFDSRL